MLTRNWPVDSFPHFSQDSQSSMKAEEFQEQQDQTVQEASNKQAKGTKDNDRGAEERDYRADLEVSVLIQGDLERYYVDFTNSSMHTNKTRDSKKLRLSVGATANKAEGLKVKHCERYHHKGRIVPFAQDSAGGLQFTNFLYHGYYK